MSRRVHHAPSAAAPRSVQSRLLVVRAAASSTDVPPNVAEARAWIAAWRAKQQPQQGGASGNGKPAAAAAAPPKAAAAPKAAKGAGKFAAASSMPDGTLVFTAEQLSAVKFSDVKLKGKK